MYECSGLTNSTCFCLSKLDSTLFIWIWEYKFKNKALFAEIDEFTVVGNIWDGGPDILSKIKVRAKNYFKRRKSLSKEHKDISVAQSSKVVWQTSLSLFATNKANKHHAQSNFEHCSLALNLPPATRPPIWLCDNKAEISFHRGRQSGLFVLKTIIWWWFYLLVNLC